MAFSPQELAHRVHRAQDLMAEQELDAIMVTGDFSAAMNYYYLSGHLPRDYQSNFSRPHIMVLKQDGEASLLVYNVNRENAADTSWVKDIRLYGPPFEHQALRDLLLDMGLQNATIGAELGQDQRLWFPVQEFLRLQESMESARFVDAADILWRLRMIKSPEEIELIRTACQINGRALRRAFGELKEGDTEKDVARLVCRFLVDGGAYRPPHSQVLVVSEAKAKSKGHRARMLGPSDDKLGKGDILFVDSGAIVEGYWGEFNRMAVVGEPTSEQEENHRNIRTVVRRSIEEAFRPGNSFRRIMEQMVEIYQDLGLEEDQYVKYTKPPYFHLAHGVGLNGSEPPFIRMDDESTLEAGMLVDVEAYLIADGVTYGSEENVLITEDGAKILSLPDVGLYMIY